jgi:hypothetical protein
VAGSNHAAAGTGAAIRPGHYRAGCTACAGGALLAARFAGARQVIIDTEEELGSPHLADAVVRYRDALAADALVIFDGPPQPPIRERTAGGSIPIAPFVSTLELPAVAVGTVNPDNNQHAPNENLRVLDFLRGIRIMAAVLSQPLR